MDQESSLANQADQRETFDVNELMADDAELKKLHADRIAQLQEETEKRVKKAHLGHGTVTDVEEGDFLEVVTKTDNVVCHFFHRDFERCKIMDKHLVVIARKYFDTRFIKVSAQVRSMDRMGLYWSAQRVHVCMLVRKQRRSTACAETHV
jgi:hypothetical protein